MNSKAGHQKEDGLVIPKTSTWDAVWEAQYSRDENDYYINAESVGQRWHDIEQFIRSRGGAAGPMKSLEIGAGRGTVSYLLHKTFGAQVTLVDFSPEALNISRDFYAHQNTEATFIQADATRLPPEMLHSYDVVYSGGLIEHFENPEKIIQAHFDAVKPGGFVIMNAPNFWCAPYRVYKILAETFSNFEVGYEKPVKYRFLRDIAVSRGFQDFSITGSGLLQTSSDWYTYFFRPMKKLFHKAFRIPYVETCRKVTDFRPERRPMWRQRGCAFLNIIIKAG